LARQQRHNGVPEAARDVMGPACDADARCCYGRLNLIRCLFLSTSFRRGPSAFLLKSDSHLDEHLKTKAIKLQGYSEQFNKLV
jgi:hypothetical protein